MVTSSIAISPGFNLVHCRSLSRGARELTQRSLDRLLLWLHPDREEAGRTYEQIRRKLIKIFVSRGCDCPDELADETLDRVSSKVDEIAGDYSGDPSLYFYGVARNVFREFCKARSRSLEAPPPDLTEPIQSELDCLDECLQRLLPRSQALLLEYYDGNGRAKIEHRKAIADRLGLEINALRIRVHRVRAVVSQCAIACLQRRSAAETSGRHCPVGNSALLPDDAATGCSRALPPNP